MPSTDRPHQPDPTPEEIRERCLEIQATWDEFEEQRRMGVRLHERQKPPYEIPQSVKHGVR